MGKERILSLIINLSLSVFASIPAAWASGGDRVPGSRYTSGRGAALGDSFIGVADDLSGGLFYNPAALGRIRGFVLEPLNVQIQANHPLINQFGADWSKMGDLASYKDTLTQSPRSVPGRSFSVMPAFGIGGFGGLGFGLLYQTRNMATSTDGVNIRYRSTYQLIPTAGYGVRLASGVLRIGYTLQWVNQASGDITKPATDPTLSYKYGLKEGAGFSHNAGMSLTLPYVFLPSAHFVARNIGGLKMSGKSLMSFAESPAGNPDTEKMSLDAAIGWVSKWGKGVDLRPSVTARDLTNTSNTSQMGRLAMGLELGLGEKFFLRGGVGSGYPSAGIGFKSTHSELNLAWFSEEVGTGYKSERDIRYIFHYILKAF
jgi:hypothetical protein